MAVGVVQQTVNQAFSVAGTLFTLRDFTKQSFDVKENVRLKNLLEQTQEELEQAYQQIPTDEEKAAQEKEVLDLIDEAYGEGYSDREDEVANLEKKVKTANKLGLEGIDEAYKEGIEEGQTISDTNRQEANAWKSKYYKGINRQDEAANRSLLNAQIKKQKGARYR